MTASGSSISSVKRPSPASRAGLRKGDIILSCSGQPVRDWVDLLSAVTGSSAQLVIQRGLSRRRITLKRGPGEELGIGLSGSEPAHCRNRCVFCFIDQQPPGLRDTLMVKDDDVRYSFLQGTYITLSDAQVETAIHRGFNSMHVSVHATDPDLRGRILGRPHPMPVLPGIDRLGARGIQVQAQVVEIPEWNQGRVLETTIADLYARDNVQILGVVPVGLTGHRKGLTPLKGHDRASAEATLELLRPWQERAMEERGFPWVYAADEYYLLSGTPVPEAKFYHGCTLAANGIGLLTAEGESCRNRLFQGSGTVVTGELAEGFIAGLLRGTGYTVLPVKNRLMGGGVTVSGLLGGEEVIEALSGGCSPGGKVFLPVSMFSHHGLTLDGHDLGSISKNTGLNVHIADSIGDLP